MAALLRPSSILPGTLRRPPTTLIGRDLERATIETYLRDPGVSLVTLAGPGGVGKTHLALDVAHRLGSLFADGIAVVDLAQVRDPGQIPAAIAGSIGLRQSPQRSPWDGILTAVGDYHLLLVLDNFEHLLAAAPLVSDLLAAAPDLKLIATSRERLGLRGEHVLHIPPLPFPPRSPRRPNARAEIEDLMTYAAVALFVDRAQAVEPGFHLTPANAVSVADVCAHLDGLPLAIELAAARVRLITPTAMLVHVGSLLSFLHHGPRDAPARHRTLSATIAWSYDLLTPDEQATLRQVALFSGGFTLAAAQAVVRFPDQETPAPKSVGDALASLVEKSLLFTGSDPVDPAALRYTHLETIREFAAERLTALGEHDTTRDRQIAYVLEAAATAAAARFGQRPVPSSDALWPERDNVRQVMAWLLVDSDPEPALRLGGTVWQWWFEWGDLGGARDLLTAAVERPGADQFPAQWATATGAIGALAQALGDHATAVDRGNAALATAHATGDDRLAAAALNTLGLDAMVRGDYGRAADLLEDGRRRFAAVGDPRAGWWCARHLASVAHRRGQMPLAAQLAAEGLAIVRAGGHEADSGGLLHTLGLALAFQGDLPGAIATWEHSLQVFQDRGDEWGIANALGGLGFAAYELGDLPRATARLEGSLALYRRIGDPEGQAFRLCHLGWTIRAQGDPVDSEHRFREALALSRSQECDQSLAGALVGLGTLALDRGDPAAAAGHWEESLRVAHQIGDHVGIATALEWIAHLGLASGAFSATSRLLAAARTIRQEFGFAWFPSDRHAHAPVAAALALAFAPETGPGSIAPTTATVDTARADASAVLAAARSLTAPPAPAAPSTAPTPDAEPVPLTRLTKQERRVLSLIAQGKTDAAIAVDLFISRPTASKHVGSVLHKLGVPTRSAAAAAAVRFGLI